MGKPGPMANAVLLGTTRVSGLPNDISFHPTALAGCTSVTDDIQSDTRVEIVGMGLLLWRHPSVSVHGRCVPGQGYPITTLKTSTPVGFGPLYTAH